MSRVDEGVSAPLGRAGCDISAWSHGALCVEQSQKVDGSPRKLDLTISCLYLSILNLSRWRFPAVAVVSRSGGSRPGGRGTSFVCRCRVFFSGADWRAVLREVFRLCVFFFVSLLRFP